MPSARQRYGSWAESVAEDFLRRKGYRILDRHVTSRYGELDILAEDNGTIVAVEVKARRNRKFGRAVEGVTEMKLARLTDAFDDILQRRSLTARPIRIDVVTVEPSGIEHLVGVDSG